jgi:hypothetical protein
MQHAFGPFCPNCRRSLLHTSLLFTCPSHVNIVDYVLVWEWSIGSRPLLVLYIPFYLQQGVGSNVYTVSYPTRGCFLRLRLETPGIGAADIKKKHEAATRYD